MSPEIEEFARILVQQVRDRAVQSFSGPLGGNSPISKRWRESNADPASVQVIVPDVVDGAVFTLLNALDQGILKMKFVASNGKEIDLTEEGEGEMGGWFMGTGGWRGMFARERFVDDFADMDD